MAEHIYEKQDIINRLEKYLGKKLAVIDNKGLFSHVKEFNLQKGIAGSIVEQCIFEYPPDTKQEADLIVKEGKKETKTELKTTGMIIDNKPQKHYVAKEPMSITAVGIYDIYQQKFENSHFWGKLENMLLVYYHYNAKRAVSPYEYREFPLVGYEFHTFSDQDIEVLKRDWQYVHDLCAKIISHHPGPRTKEWKAKVKQEYIEVHGQLRRVLSYTDLAPKYPPRFRLKKSTVSSIIARHFNYHLEQLPGTYITVSDIDLKCRELTLKYRGKTIEELSQIFDLPTTSAKGAENKGITERIIISMFGGTSKKLNQIELFSRFGMIGKTVVQTSKGGRTEDMKLFHVDFSEIARMEFVEEDGTVRPLSFEDSDLYAYFADHEFLCIIFEEPKKEYVLDEKGKKVEKEHKLIQNKFIGFKRLVFSDKFIDGPVRRLWEDTRKKVLDNTLKEIIQKRKDGSIIINKSGSISSALNLLKGADNEVFIKCSGTDTSEKSKTEIVNGMKVLPQYVWIKGTSIIKELEKTPEL